MFITTTVKTYYEGKHQRIIDAFVAVNDGNLAFGSDVLLKITNEIDNYKIQLANISEEKVLNELFVLSVYISFLQNYITTWHLIKCGQYRDSWRSLQDTLNELRIVKRFSENNLNSKHLEFFEDQLLSLEKLYPYHVFFSMGATVEYYECSICGKDTNSIECIHVAGELYQGVMAAEIAHNLKLHNVSIVKNPRDKRCVVTYEDSSDKFKLIRYLADLINQEKLKLFDFGELRFSQEPMANPEYVKLKRNQICFCGSGKKFKYCCIDKKVVTNHIVEIIGKINKVQDIMY